MSSNQFDNSHAAALDRARIAHQNNWPAPAQQPGQSADSHNTTVNQLNRLNKQSGK
jgi:hypothetical protein